MVSCFAKIFTSFHDMVFLIDFPDFPADSRNDGNAHGITRHLVQMPVRKPGGLHLIELLIGKSLQPPALNGHQLSDSAVMHNAVPVLRSDGEHRLTRLFHPPAVLTDSFPIRRQDRSRNILHEYAGVSSFVVSHAGIVPGNQAPRFISDSGFRIQVNEIQPCFAAPAARSCTLRTGYAVGAVDS